MQPLPIDEHLPQIAERLERPGSLVLVADPGAGNADSGVAVSGTGFDGWTQRLAHFAWLELQLALNRVAQRLVDLHIAELERQMGSVPPELRRDLEERLHDFRTRHRNILDTWDRPCWIERTPTGASGSTPDRSYGFTCLPYRSRSVETPR